MAPVLHVCKWPRNFFISIILLDFLGGFIFCIAVGERYSSQDARSVIANTFNILSQKLNTEDLGPVYDTVQQLGARKGKMAWRTTITVNWPKPFRLDHVLDFDCLS